MGLLPAWRGRGVGRRLLEATVAKARCEGFKRIELDVYADNPRAIALYEKAGFVREGIVRDASLIDGVFRDADPHGDRGALKPSFGPRGPDPKAPASLFPGPVELTLADRARFLRP